MYDFLVIESNDSSAAQKVTAWRMQCYDQQQSNNKSDIIVDDDVNEKKRRRRRARRSSTSNANALSESTLLVALLNATVLLVVGKSNSSETCSYFFLIKWFFSLFFFYKLKNKITLHTQKKGLMTLWSVEHGILLQSIIDRKSFLFFRFFSFLYSTILTKYVDQGDVVMRSCQFGASLAVSQSRRVAACLLRRASPNNG